MSFSGFVTVEVLSFVLFYFFSGKARLHTCVLGRNKKSTNIAFVFLWLLCILFGVFIYAGIFKPAATYPFETLYNKNAYEQQFDAFLKHRLSIDIEPAKELLALSNPYDRASRTGIRFLWDRALYDGKYYSYFGITPIITVYYPYYFITGKVPSAATVCFILFTAAVTAVALTYLKAVGIFCEKPNKALVFFGFAAVESGSLLFMLLTSADMYYTAVISGVCFLSLFMMFSLAAYEKKKTAAKCADFFFAGISFVLTKKTENWKRATFLLGVIMPIAVAFLDMCLGGVNIRYLADIAFIAVLFGTLIIINLYSAVPDNQKALKITAYIIFTLILYVSAFVGFLTVFENERYSNFSILS